jgi:hypothetical protein
MVRNSEHGVHLDPQTDICTAAKATRLSEEDARLGVLDLVEAGVIEEIRNNQLKCVLADDRSVHRIRPSFLDFNTVDAVAIANWLVSQNIERMVTKDLAGHFSDWRAAPLEQRTQLS